MQRQAPGNEAAEREYQRHQPEHRPPLGRRHAAGFRRDRRFSPALPQWPRLPKARDEEMDRQHDHQMHQGKDQQRHPPAEGFGEQRRDRPEDRRGQPADHHHQPDDAARLVSHQLRDGDIADIGERHRMADADDDPACEIADRPLRSRQRRQPDSADQRTDAHRPARAAHIEMPPERGGDQRARDQQHGDPAEHHGRVQPDVAMQVEHQHRRRPIGRAPADDARQRQAGEQRRMARRAPANRRKNRRGRGQSVYPGGRSASESICTDWNYRSLPRSGRSCGAAAACKNALDCSKDRSTSLLHCELVSRTEFRRRVEGSMRGRMRNQELH